MSKSDSLFARACLSMPGGVNSPVRAFKSVGGTPPFIVKGKGAKLFDADGNEYLDFVGSWGPLIIGHAHPRVVSAVQATTAKGLSFGACHEGEIMLAEAIKRAMPQVEMLRLVNSGTEAAMSAVRLARAATGRDAIVKFQGCYHGHADSFLISAGSGALTFGTPSSPGVPSGAARDTLLAQYNDLASVEAVFAVSAPRIACVIVEPVAGNMGVIPPAPGFLEGLRKICDKHGALLIFDEVITGFRVAFGGAAELYSVTPDLTVLGKIIGGGMPVGAYGGKADLMRRLSPLGPVYQAGTLSGNPLACAAGLATIEVLRNENPYARLDTLAAEMEAGIAANLKEAGIVAAQNRVGSMSTLFFGIDQASTLAQANKADTAFYGRYHAAMLKQGIYLAPAQFEAAFISTQHDSESIGRLLEAQRIALREAK